MFKPYLPARGTRHTLAIGFLSFAITALFAPDIISALMVRDEFQGYPIAGLAIGALGAHAMAAGIFALFARFTSWTFAGFGVAILPMLVMDYWLFAVAGAFNAMILVHAGGTIVMLALCVRGFRLLQRHEQALEQPV